MKDKSTEYVEAAVERALTGDQADHELPTALRKKLIHEGQQYFEATRQPSRSITSELFGWLAKPALSWAVACACLVLVFLKPWQPQPATGLPTTVAALHETLGTRQGVVDLAWRGLGDPAFDRVSGYVRWDAAAQQGVMRLDGMPVNDPALAQYQLWIVDPQRDANPVDGGVFDLTEGENLVAIDAKLQIVGAKAFAITLEQPGGVVVSEGPLLVIASG